MGNDVCADFGRIIEVEPIRRFNSTKATLGVAFDEIYWFVYYRADDEPWHKHCGPYSTREQAVEWIRAIREEA